MVTPTVISLLRGWRHDMAWYGRSLWRVAGGRSVRLRIGTMSLDRHCRQAVWFNVNGILMNVCEHAARDQVVAWLEATACDTFLVGIGGHFVYDMAIPIAILTYYMYVRGQEQASSLARKRE